MDAERSRRTQDILADHDLVERAALSAAREVARRHRYHGVPVVVERDGEIANISPDEFEALLDEREARLDAAKSAATPQSNGRPAS